MHTSVCVCVSVCLCVYGVVEPERMIGAEAGGRACLCVFVRMIESNRVCMVVGAARQRAGCETAVSQHDSRGEPSHRPAITARRERDGSRDTRESRGIYTDVALALMEVGRALGLGFDTGHLEVGALGPWSAVVASVAGRSYALSLRRLAARLSLLMGDSRTPHTHTKSSRLT